MNGLSHRGHIDQICIKALEGLFLFLLVGKKRRSWVRHGVVESGETGERAMSKREE